MTGIEKIMEEATKKFIMLGQVPRDQIGLSLEQLDNLVMVVVQIPVELSWFVVEIVVELLRKLLKVLRDFARMQLEIVINMGWVLVKIVGQRFKFLIDQLFLVVVEKGFDIFDWSLVWIGIWVAFLCRRSFDLGTCCTMVTLFCCDVMI